MKIGYLPAFPSHGSMGEVVQDGMTLRQHFAGLALQGLLVNAGRNSLDFHNAHQEAVRQADLLLAELEKSE